MKTTNQKNDFLPKIYCNIFGHNYGISKKVTYFITEYTCSHCKKQATTDTNGKIVELTPKHKEINAILKRIHLNKLKRLKRKTCSIPNHRSYLKSS